MFVVDGVLPTQPVVVLVIELNANVLTPGGVNATVVVSTPDTGPVPETVKFVVPPSVVNVKLQLSVASTSLTE